MAHYVTDCPRCSAKKMTFSILAVNRLVKWAENRASYEAFSVCGLCNKTTTFVVECNSQPLISAGIVGYEGTINNWVDHIGHLDALNFGSLPIPDHVPEKYAKVFLEGGKCHKAKCYNAAGAMFRLCIDLVTSDFLPDEAETLNYRTRRDLGLRLPWMFENKLLPDSIKELSTCIREDGNDAAHRGNLTKEDAEDLLDFLQILLERVFTEPRRLELAKERRELRRAPTA